MLYNDNKTKRTVILRFKRKELLYDLENNSFIEGDIARTDDEHERHQVFDIARTGNIDRVSRVLSLAHSECVEMLFPYTKKGVTEDTQHEDFLENPDEYIITMIVPSSFSKSTIDILRNLIHEYLVCRVMEDWMSLTKPASQSNWRDKLEYLKAKIRTSLMSRVEAVRRKQSPF